MKVTNTHKSTLMIAATGQVVEPGDSVEVADELGKSLIEQVDRWSSDKPASKAKPTKPKADKADESEEDE